MALLWPQKSLYGKCFIGIVDDVSVECSLFSLLFGLTEFGLCFLGGYFYGNYCDKLTINFGRKST